ncbi:hypothetical protein PIB30_106705, partial [Stylosanthes scabra]|nr:hypothetical protein [Stylosanthes scabra]
MQLDCDKCRRKALKIAAQERGVSSVALEGDERDTLVVTGEVDAVCLARVLRKKFKCVNLVSVQELKKKNNDDKYNQDNNNHNHNNNNMCYYPPLPSAPPIGPYYHYPNNYDPTPKNCSI